MRRLVLLCTALPLLALAAACSMSAASTAPLSVSCDEFGATNKISKSLQVAPGASFSFTLCSNPTTGYQWEEAKVADSAVIRQSSRKYAPPGSNQAGAPGQETWTFKAQGKGTTAITIDYSRPWAGGEKGTWTFTLNVEVK